MRKYWMTSIMVLPLLLGCSQAAQNYSSDPPAGQPWIFSSDEGGSSSYLGVDINDITAERLSALKLKEEKGVEVTMVDQDAPAGKAGIKEHDVILSMNGTPIESKAQLQRMIHETPAGRVISLGLSRDGQPITVKVQLADKHHEFPSAWVTPDIHVQVPDIHLPDIDIPAITVMVTTSARSGLTMENLSPQLGEFFGVKNGNGVLIRAVEKGSRAEKAGFRAGDVIVKVNDQPVHDTSDFAHGMKSRNGNSVNVVVVRDKREQTLTLSLPNRKETGDLLDDESLDSEPLLQAESELKLSKLKQDMATLQPDLQLAMKNSRKAFEDMQKQFRQQSEQQRERMQKDMEHFRQQLLHMKDDWL